MSTVMRDGRSALRSAVAVTVAMIACKSGSARHDDARAVPPPPPDAAVPLRDAALPAEPIPQVRVPALPRAIAAWMPAAASDAWQGNWQLPIDRRWRSAVEINGDRAIVFDGAHDRGMGFGAVLPCEARFARGAPTSWREFHLRYALRAGELFVSRFAIGLRRDRQAIVCAVDGVYVLDARGHCDKWTEFGDARWQREKAHCVWSGSDRLQVGTSEGGEDLVADGDVLFEGTSLQHVDPDVATRYPDAGAARNAATAERVLHDPSELAKSAGGRVGDRASILGLQATLGDDPTLVGASVEVTGWVVEASVATSGKLVTHTILVADHHTATPPLLECIATGAVAATLDEHVRVRGEVLANPDDELMLGSCSVARAP